MGEKKSLPSEQQRGPGRGVSDENVQLDVASLGSSEQAP